MDSFFIRAAQATQARQSLTLEELYQMFRDGADGVISRGKAEPGDKTTEPRRHLPAARSVSIRYSGY